MNRLAPDVTRTTGDDGGSAAPLDELVCAALGRRVRGLRIEVPEGGLVLRGRADSDHAKLLAQYAVMAVTGLPLIANKIEVVDPVGPGRAGRSAPPPKLLLLATGDVRLPARPAPPRRARLCGRHRRRRGGVCDPRPRTRGRGRRRSRRGPALGRRRRRARAVPRAGHSDTSRLARPALRRLARAQGDPCRPGRLGGREARPDKEPRGAPCGPRAKLPRPGRKHDGGGEEAPRRRRPATRGGADPRVARSPCSFTPQFLTRRPYVRRLHPGTDEPCPGGPRR